ncbi:MAG: DUF1842 domain-containing protein [Patescibacteria group bacterium]|nr:DUF1842 domain-containing protein [Patescibacteria group bacterium]
MKKYLGSLAVVLGLALVTGIVYAAVTGAPGAGLSLSQKTHYQAVDGNGNVVREIGPNVGYRAFHVSGDYSYTTAVPITDLSGNNPSCAVVHSVCLNDVAQTVAVFDSTTTAPNVQPVLGDANQVTPQVLGTTSAATCMTVDAQINDIPEVLVSSNNVDAEIYWRPCSSHAQ